MSSAKPASRRPGVPERLEAQVLFASDHTCCICRDRGNDVQVHHIDSNPRNNVIGNLAALCPNCHSRATGTRGMGKAYKPLEVALYKEAWETHIQEKRGLLRPMIGHRDELAAQADLVVCEIAALPVEDERALVLLNKLLLLHELRGDPELDQVLIEGLQFLAVKTGMSGSSLAELVLLDLWAMSAEFVGPDETPMDEAGRKRVLSCLEGVAQYLESNARGHRAPTALLTATLVLEFFADIATRYSDEELMNTVVGVHERGLNDGRAYGPLFVEQQHELLRSLETIRERLEESVSDWSAQIELITTIEREYGLTYIYTSSKEGYATLSVDHPASRQSLVVPVHPSNSIHEVLPLLHPVFAHYCGQLEKFMVDDPEETDTRGYVLEARYLSSTIADPSRGAELKEIVWRHTDKVIREFLGDRPPEALFSPAISPYSSNLWSVVLLPEEFGIDPIVETEAAETDDKGEAPNS